MAYKKTAGDDKAVTKWLNPTAMSKTSYGFVSNKAWLWMEQTRLERATGDKYAIKENLRSYKDNGRVVEKMFMRLVRA